MARDSIYIHGAGKVGRALAKKLRAKKYTVTLRPARKGAPKKIKASVVILAVRDRDIPRLAEELASRVHPKSVCLHVAGALGPDVLEPLRRSCAGVAQMHPMISFASRSFFPSLDRGNVRVAGDPVAMKKATAIAKALGMTPRDLQDLDTVGYHAAAGLVANGAAALCAIGAQLLEVSGVPKKKAPKLLGPLLRSVAENVEALGFPDALTGPVRRGDPKALEKHLNVLRERLPGAIPLYLASIHAQLPLAKELGEAPSSAFVEIERWLEAQK
jgi:predicted short-subunit dehydrogenase-like oxidoreductase (DUF2520 family)